MESPKTLTREEMQVLLDWLRLHLPRYDGYHRQLRDYGLAVFLCETGLRVGELVGLRLGDVVFAGEAVKTLVVRAEIAKGKKERSVPVSAALKVRIGILARKLWYAHLDEGDSYCWYRTDRFHHLSVRSVEGMVRKAGLAALGRPVHPHVLRHTFATNMMRVTSARVVQELLGHADLRSTQIYTHPNGDDLAAAIAAKDAVERGNDG